VVKSPTIANLHNVMDEFKKRHSRHRHKLFATILNSYATNIKINWRPATTNKNGTKIDYYKKNAWTGYCEYFEL